MIVLNLVLILFCCIIIWRASDGFETASEYIGRNLTDLGEQIRNLLPS